MEDNVIPDIRNAIMDRMADGGLHGPRRGFQMEKEMSKIGKDFLKDIYLFI